VQPPKEPITPNVARAGAIMVASLFLSRVLGLVRDMVMARQFGLGFETDAYVLAFQIPDLLFFLIAGGALSSAFIPVFSEYLHTNREEDAWKVFSVVVTVMSIVITAFILVTGIFTEQLLPLVAPGASPEQIPLVARMSRIVLPAQFAFFIGGIMFGTLYARQRFAAPGLGPNIYNIGIIFGALVLSAFFEPSIVGMSVGALIGAMIGNLIIPLIVMRSLGSHFRPSLDLSHPGVKKVFKLMLPVVLGLSLPGVYAMIMRAFASGFPDGIVTGVDYANKIMQAPLGIFGQSMAIAVFPALAQFFAQQRMDRYRDTLTGTLKTVIYITVPISAILFVLAPEIVVSLFEQGRFRPEDTAVTAACLRMFAIGLFAWCLHPVLMRAFFAVHSTVVPIAIGTLVTGIFIALAFVLIRTPLSYTGLPLAGSISAVVLVAIMVGAIGRKSGGLDYRSLGATLLKCGAGGGAATLLVYLTLQFLPDEIVLGRKIYALIKVGALGLLAAWFYYFLARLLRAEGSGYVDRALRRITRSPEAKVESDESEIGRQ
jgi:putative peptidoglycan lipid II flippase